MKYYLLAFFFVYLLTTMILPSWRVQKMTGEKAFLVPNDDSAQGFIGKVFRFLFLLAFLVLGCNACFPEWMTFLAPFSYLENQGIYLAGISLLHFSLFIVLLAQYQMSASWRIGFSDAQQTELVTNGLFRYSRNPVFLGMLLTMTGLFLILPNAFTLLGCILIYVVLQIQIRLEEAFLLQKQGDKYRSYMARVPRWL